MNDGFPPWNNNTSNNGSPPVLSDELIFKWEYKES